MNNSIEIIEEVRKFVEEECKKPSSKYGYGPYKYHFVSVHKYAKILAEKLGADVEIVEISAWLHDIGSIIYGREDHHITGARIAEEKLKEFNYPLDRIERVKQCILSHRGSREIRRESIEAQILADADGMSHFDDVLGIFKAAFVYEGLDEGGAKISAIEKLRRTWKKLSPSAKEVVKQKYDAAEVLLG